jgi:voltage-gated potassium channel
MTNVRLRLLLALSAVVLVFAVGTLGYRLICSPSWADAVYMTAITLSTVGYREPEWITAGGRAWSVLVMTLGVGSLALTLSFLTVMLTGGELRRVLGRRVLTRQINQLSGHTIVCGYGRVGQMLVSQLAEHKVSPVVIDKDPAKTARLDQAGNLYILGDATDEDVLMQAGLMHARALISVLAHDVDNVYVTLTARAARSDLIIIARAEQPDTEHKLRRAGASKVVCPSVIGALRMANILLRPNVVDFVDVAAKGVDLEMDEYVVPASSHMVGKTIREAQLRQKADVMVVAIKRANGSSEFNPGPDAALQAGDTLILVGQAGSSERLGRLEEGS